MGSRSEGGKFKLTHYRLPPSPLHAIAIGKCWRVMARARARQMTRNLFPQREFRAAGGEGVRLRAATRCENRRFHNEPRFCEKNPCKCWIPPEKIWVRFSIARGLRSGFERLTGHFRRKLASFKKPIAIRMTRRAFRDISPRSSPMPLPDAVES